MPAMYCPSAVQAVQRLHFNRIPFWTAPVKSRGLSLIHIFPYEIKDRRAGDIPECYADSTKAFEELGWKAEKTLDDMCADSWRWQTQNPNGYNA